MFLLDTWILLFLFWIIPAAICIGALIDSLGFTLLDLLLKQISLKLVAPVCFESPDSRDVLLCLLKVPKLKQRFGSTSQSFEEQLLS